MPATLMYLLLTKQGLESLAKTHQECSVHVVCTCQCDQVAWDIGISVANSYGGALLCNDGNAAKCTQIECPAACTCIAPAVTSSCRQQHVLSCAWILQHPGLLHRRAIPKRAEQPCTITSLILWPPADNRTLGTQLSKPTCAIAGTMDKACITRHHAALPPTRSVLSTCRS